MTQLISLTFATIFCAWLVIYGAVNREWAVFTVSIPALMCVIIALYSKLNRDDEHFKY